MTITPAAAARLDQIAALSAAGAYRAAAEHAHGDHMEVTYLRRQAGEVTGADYRLLEIYNDLWDMAATGERELQMGRRAYIERLFGERDLTIGHERAERGGRVYMPDKPDHDR